jgi:hypothetical protein
VVVDYIPYRYGCWNYSPAFGNVWVGAYPFCYVTSHYGRWNNVASYGWVWSYDPVWSPAWATTVCAGDYLMWSPMGFDNRPVMVTQSASFGIGGVNFCVSSTSWMPMSYVTTGWAPVSACTPVFADTLCTLPPAQINVWNIYGGERRRPHPSPFDSNVFHERDYNPPRSIRGLAAPQDGPAPGERVHALEARMGRERFAPVERTGGHMERSTGGRGTSMRSVRLENVTALQPDTAPGLAEMRRNRSVDNTASNPEARRDPGGRELRTGRDSGRPAQTNDAVGAAQTGSPARSGNPEARSSAPTSSGEGRTPVRGESRNLRGTTPDRMDMNGGSGTDRALRGQPTATTPRSTNSGRGSIRDIDPGTPAPGGAARFQSTPEKTPVRGGARTAPGGSPTPFNGSRGDSAMNPRSSRLSDLPTFPSTRSSRPLSFDTDASRSASPRMTSPRAESSAPQGVFSKPREESAPRFEAPSAPTVQHSDPVVPQERYEAPQSRIEPPRQRVEAPQQRIETPQPRFERSEPLQQPRFQAPQQRMESPQPRFEAPRMSAPSTSPRSTAPDTNSSSDRSSRTRGEIRGR